jgi:hypothetical protein
MSTAKFMKQMGKKQGFKKEAPGFFDRWVHGTGEYSTYVQLSCCMKKTLVLKQVQPGLLNRRQASVNRWVHGTGDQQRGTALIAVLSSHACSCIKRYHDELPCN